MGVILDIDSNIISAVKLDNYDSFEQLFRKYFEQLCRYAGCMLGDSGQAEDVVQDVFVYFWEHREEIEVKSSVRSYLYTAVRNQVLKLLQKRGIERKHNPRLTEFVEYLLSVDYTPEEEEEIERVKTVMQELPPQCQKVFLMSCLEDKKYTEIASELDISVNTVKSHITKAYRLIRERLNTEELLILMLLAIHWEDTSKDYCLF